MTQLQSTKAINNLKTQAINKGGYQKHKEVILKACEEHKKNFGHLEGFNDLTPKQLK